MTLNEKIYEMTSAEIYSIVFNGKAVNEYTGLDIEVAEAIITHPNYKGLDTHLRDWAWNTFDAEYTEYVYDNLTN